MTQKQLTQKIQQIIEQAKALGATEVEVDAAFVLGSSVSVRLGELENVEHNEDTGINVNVYFGKQKASVSTSDISDSAIDKVVKQACQIARYTEHDKFAGLVDKKLLAVEYPALDLYIPWQTDIKAMTDLALECETKALSLDKRIANSEGACVYSYQTSKVYGASNGFLAGYQTTKHGINLSLIAADGSEMQRDGEYTVARDAGDLWATDKLADLAVKKAIAKLGARKVKTQAVPVVFAAEIASSLFANFLSAIRGANLYKRSSFLCDSLGTKVFPDFISLHEDPFIKKGLASSPFDAEGVRIAPRDIVKDGVVQGYLLNSYSARQLNMQTTGNCGGWHNVLVSHSNKTEQDLLRDMGTGLLVTELIGQGTNLTTGDYSHGVAGFWVENGEIQYPVDEITIASTLPEMFNNIVAVANNLDTRSSIVCGSVLIANMQVAGD